MIATLGLGATGTGQWTSQALRTASLIAPSTHGKVGAVGAKSPAATAPSGPVQIAGSTDIQELDALDPTSSLIVAAGGILGGSGLVPGSLVNQGVLAPGHSPGLLEIAGDFLQESDAVLDIELGGSGEEDFDRILVGGIAVLSGLVNVLLIDGFEPAAGESFDVLVAQQIVDAGATFALPAVDAADLSIAIVELAPGIQSLQILSSAASTASAVPEPGRALLLAVVAALTAVRSQRAGARGSPSRSPSVPCRW